MFFVSSLVHIYFHVICYLFTHIIVEGKGEVPEQDLVW